MNIMTALLIRYTFDDGYGGGTKNPEYISDGLTSSPFESNDGGSVFTLGNPGLAILDNGWDVTDNSRWFSFTIEPGQDMALSLESISFSHKSSLIGPSSWKVRTSLDGFSSNLGSGDTTLLEKWHNEIFSASLQTTLPLEIRLYGTGAAQDSGTWRIDNVEVKGTIGYHVETSSSSSSVSSTSSSSDSSTSVSSTSSTSLSSSSLSLSSLSSTSSFESGKSSSSSSTSSFESGKSSSSSQSTSSSSHSSSSLSQLSNGANNSSSSSSSSTYMRRWQAVSLDIDEDTGEAYVAVRRKNGTNYILRIDASNHRILDQCYLPSGMTLNSLYIQQGVNGLLPFSFEIIESRTIPTTLGFSFTGVAANSNDLSGVVNLSPSAKTIPIQTDSVDVMVWGRGEAGIKGTKQGVNGTFETASATVPSKTIRLPVFSWSSQSMVNLPSIAVSMEDGSYLLVDYDKSLKKDKVKIRSKITPDKLPMGGEASTSMAVNPNGQTIFLSNKTGIIEVEASTFTPMSMIELGEGGVVGGVDGLIINVFNRNPSRLRSVNNLGGDVEVIGCSKKEGKLFTTTATILYSSSSSNTIWPSSSSSSQSSDSSVSSVSSGSSKSSKSSSSSSDSNSNLGCSGIGCMIIGHRLPGQTGPLFIVGGG